MKEKIYKHYQLSFSQNVIYRFRTTLINSNMSKTEIEEYVEKIRGAWIYKLKLNAAIVSGSLTTINTGESNYKDFYVFVFL